MQKKREHFQIHFMTPAFPWYQKQRHHKEKLQANISCKNRYENSQQYNSKLNLAIYEKDYTA